MKDKAEYLPTNPYEYMGFFHFQANMIAYLLEELIRVSPDEQKAAQACKQYAQECADSGISFVAGELGEWDTEETRLGIAAGLQKAKQQFMIKLGDVF